jgi:hypothetical protein
VCWWRSYSSVISCRLVCRYQGFGEASIFVFIIRVVQESAYLLITPWSRVLIEKLTGFQLVKIFPAFYGTRRFIIAFTSARHQSLSWATSIQPIPPHPIPWRSILMLSSHVPLGLPSGLLPSGFPTKTLYSPRIYMASYPTRLKSPRFSLRCLQIVGLCKPYFVMIVVLFPIKRTSCNGRNAHRSLYSVSHPKWLQIFSNLCIKVYVTNCHFGLIVFHVGPVCPPINVMFNKLLRHSQKDLSHQKEGLVLNTSVIIN